jgi:hypothetical protein
MSRYLDGGSHPSHLWLVVDDGQFGEFVTVAGWWLLSSSWYRHFIIIIPFYVSFRLFLVRAIATAIWNAPCSWPRPRDRATIRQCCKPSVPS